MINIEYEDEAVNAALEFAVKWHGDQKRAGGGPYWIHLVDVLNILDAEYAQPILSLDLGDSGPYSMNTRIHNMRIAALLHDVLEDTACSRTTLLKYFGEDVLGLVVELTNKYTKEAYPNLNRKERKTLERLRLSEASSYAQNIKCCDVISNARSSHELNRDFADKMLGEFEDLIKSLTKADYFLRDFARREVAAIRNGARAEPYRIGRI